MKHITVSLMEFSELENAAKEKALEDNRYINVDNDYWYDSMFEYFCELCKMLGIEASWKTIHFRGFSSQGDGSAYEGPVNVSQLIKAIKHNVWKEQFPTIELAFQTCPCDKRVIALIENKKIDIWCKIIQRSHLHYNVSVEANFNYSSWACRNYDQIDKQLNDLEQWIDSVSATLNAYLYKGLQSEYEEMLSDEAVKETIESNAYLFTKDGKMATHIEALAE